MPWAPSSYGLAVPNTNTDIDTTSPLAHGLCSLWVPSLGLAPNGVTNLAPSFPGLMEYQGATVNPFVASTDYGMGLRFDGQNDFLLRQSPVAFVPQTNPRNTWGIVLRMDAFPTTGNYVIVYGFNHINNVGGRQQLDISDNRVRFYYTGDNGTTTTVVQIDQAVTLGQIVFITACMDSYSNARISFWEPSTNRYLTNSTTAGTTTQSAAATFPISTETLGSRYYGNFSDSFAACTILDAWFWNRSLSEQDLELWRYNRWSVTRPKYLKSYYIGKDVVVSGQILTSNSSLITQGAILRANSTTQSVVLTNTSSFIAGSSGSQKSSAVDGATFTLSAGLVFGGSYFLREDFYKVLREDNRYPLRESGGIVTAQNFNIVTDPFVASVSFSPGSMAGSQTTNVSGFLFNKTYSLFSEGAFGQAVIASPGQTFAVQSRLSLAGSRFIRQDGGLILRQDGSVLQHEDTQPAIGQIRNIIPGTTFVSTSTLLPAGTTNQLAAKPAGVTLNQFGLFFAGSPAPSLTFGPMTASSTLLTGAVTARRVATPVAQVLSSASSLILSNPIVTTNTNPISNTATGQTFSVKATGLYGSGIVANMAGVTGITATASASLTAGVSMAQRRQTAAGTTFTVASSLTVGTTTTQRNALVASQQFVAVRNLIAGSAIAVKASVVAGVTFDASVALISDNNSLKSSIRVPGQRLIARASLVRGNILRQRSAVIYGRSWQRRVIIRKGRTSATGRLGAGYPAGTQTGSTAGTVIPNKY